MAESYNPLPLAPWQCDQLVKRRRSDVNLFDHGAFIDENERVTLPPYLLERMQLMLDIDPWFILEARDGVDDHDALLDAPLADIWLQVGLKHRTTNVPRNLSGGGIRTIRDVLVSGRQSIGEVRGIGQTALAQIDSALEASGVTIEFEDRPTPEQIAQFCVHLGQVNLRALGIRQLYSSFHEPASVADILKTPIARRSEFVMRRMPYAGVLPPHLLDEVANIPETFGYRFSDARSEIEYPNL